MMQNRSAGQGIGGLVMVLVTSLAASVAWLMHLTVEERYLALPALVAINTAIAFWSLLIRRDGKVPVFDAGSLCAAATLLYTLMPIGGFLLGGLAFGALSDSRFLQHDPSTSEIGAMAWRYVLYFVCFSATYVLVRGKDNIDSGGIERADRVTLWVIVVLLVITATYQFALRATTGVSLDTDYGNLADSAALYQQLPLLLRQVTGHFLQIGFIIKLGFLMVLFQKYDSRGWRAVLYSWLAAEVFLSFMKLGSRSDTVLLLLASGLLYHRMVRPMPLKVVVPLGLTLLSGFLIHGFVRMGFDVAEGENPLTAINEFQSLFGTAYDVHKLKESGSIDVPWQIYFADLLRLFPQQIVPFQKMDPSDWYLRLIGQENLGVGFTFGVIAESVLGFDWIELAVRGAVLGVILALLHGWYMRNSGSMFATLFYLWLCIKIYITFRSSTFYLITHAVFQFLPAFILIKYGARLLEGAARRKPRATWSRAVPT